MRSQQDLSFSDVRSMLWDAVRTRFGEGAELCSDGIFFSYVIFSRDGKFYRIGYMIVDGAVKLADAESAVEKKWVEIRSAQAESEETAEMRVILDAPKDPEGLAWEVTIIQPGFTKHSKIPWFFPDEVLRADAAIFEGADVNLYDLPANGATHVPDNIVDVKPYLVKSKTGWIDTVRHVAGEGVKGVLHLLDSFAWLGKNMLRAAKDGLALPYGLSIDFPARASLGEIEGKTAVIVKKIVGAGSVDIVSRPAAGGKFIRAIAALNDSASDAETIRLRSASYAATREEKIMDKKALWDFIMRIRADLLAGKAFETIEEKELRAIMDTMEPVSATAMPGKPNDGDQVKLLRCEMALDRELVKSELPEKVQAKLRNLFGGKVFETEQLTRVIADEKDILADYEKTLRSDEPIPGSGIRMGLGTLARAQMAIDRTFGLTQEDMQVCARMTRLDNQPFFDDRILRSRQDLEEFKDVPAFAGLRDIYAFFTGDPEVSGRFNRKNLSPELRASMDINSATFTYVLGNTLARRLVKDYNATNFLENLLISIRKPVKDFRQQEAVLVGYFGNLDTVDPEAKDYDEIAAVTDEESTYTLGQKGNILTITRKTIINDDISLVQRLVSRLGRAARRTHAEYVWAFFIDNANCSDATAWFTGGHGNLGATALSHATANIAYIALAKMTEKDSGKRIGLLDDPSVKPVLVYPPDLIATAKEIVDADHYFSANDLTTKIGNPLFGRVRGEMVSLFTDPNDWGLLMPPDVADMVEMGYLNGRQEPEMFVADAPQAEQVFVADKIRHKIRHEYAGAVIEYVSGYKAVVA
jgi:hypothetical protein